MTGVLIGYARCSTDEQDLTAQRDRLRELGVPDERVYLDHGLTGTNRQRPGLDQALAAVRGGDTLVVPKLDRLARSVPDARAIGDDLATRGIKLSLGGQVYDPTDPMGKMFFNILATFDASYERMSAAGVEFVTSPRTEPYGRVAGIPRYRGQQVGPARSVLIADDKAQHSRCRVPLCGWGQLRECWAT